MPLPDTVLYLGVELSFTLRWEEWLNLKKVFTHVTSQKQSSIGVLLKKVFLEISQNAQVNINLCQCLFFNKAAHLRPAALLEGDSGTGFFQWILWNF